MTTATYTFYIDKATEVSFPILYVAAAGQSMKYQEIQNTAPLLSSPGGGVGYGTVNALKTTNVDQQNDINANYTWLCNMAGTPNGPPAGCLAITFPFWNGTSAPTSASNNPSENVPNGVSATYDGLVVTDQCTGAYFGATGVAYKTKSNATPFRLYVVEVTFA